MLVRSTIPEIRIRAMNGAPVRRAGQFVVYWMIAYRRTRWNFSLQRAAEWAAELNQPLIVFEPLRIGYRWASDRIHRFVIDGMADQSEALAGRQSRGVLYHPYVEPTEGAGKGSLEMLARQASLVVTDDFPCGFLPRMVDAAAKKLSVRLEAVDSNGILPLRSVDRVFTAAHSFRRHLQKVLRDHLGEFPRRDPLARLQLPAIRGLPKAFVRRWPAADRRLLQGDGNALSGLAIDHAVPPLDQRGGPREAVKRLRRFVSRRLAGYADRANHPDDEARSGISPYLHFGHLSAHEAVDAVLRREDWNPSLLADAAKGRRLGWWGMSEDAECWLDELITWRELGFNASAHHLDFDQYESLPDWARKTLARHARDRRRQTYTLEQLEAAQTHDPIWNAAQRQLRHEGVIHNYLRMLWGKKILEWTREPREALRVMIELNNRWAIDGRDPNSYSGIFWVLGRYDRAWGPERPIFGTIRYMSSDNTRRKLRLANYMQRWDSDPAVR